MSQKFTSLGLDVQPEEIFSSSFAAAAYLESIGFGKEGTEYTGKKVYTIGEVGIDEELDMLNIEHIGGPADAGKRVTLAKGERMDQDPDVAAVVVGFDREVRPACTLWCWSALVVSFVDPPH